MLPPLSYSIKSHCALLLLCLANLISGTYGDCDPPPVLAHTDPIKDTSFPVGTAVVYSCDQKNGYYELPGFGRTIVCLSDSTWSTIPEFCSRACDSPPRLIYAELKQEFIDQNIYLNGTKVQYNCRPGYVRTSGTKASITCLDDFTWSTPDVFCQRRSCGNPGDIENGEMHAVDFLVGSRVNYTCNEGYRMISKMNSRECQADGSWSNSVPTCEVTICVSPGDIADGSYNPQKDEYQYLDSVTYTCKGNLALVGNASIFCTSDGNWNSDPPLCKSVMCSNPSVPNSRRLSGFVGPYYLNSAVRFECTEGFMMNGSDSVICNINSEWEPSVPQCLRFCGSPPTLKYAVLKQEYTTQRFFVGTTVEYVCKAGYVNSASSETTTSSCLESSTWTSPAEFCERRSCGDPGKMENGKCEAVDFLYGTRATCSCNKGYRIASQVHYRDCQADGRWSNSVPDCEAVTCPPPDVIQNGDYSPKKKDYQYLESVNYTCSEKFSLAGIGSIHCTETGRWSFHAPECKEESSHNLALILGIVAGVLILILLLVCFVCCYKKKAKTGKPKNKSDYSAHYTTYSE